MFLVTPRSGMSTCIVWRNEKFGNSRGLPESFRMQAAACCWQPYSDGDHMDASPWAGVRICKAAGSSAEQDSAQSTVGLFLGEVGAWSQMPSIRACSEHNPIQPTARHCGERMGTGIGSEPFCSRTVCRNIRAIDPIWPGDGIFHNVDFTRRIKS